MATTIPRRARLLRPRPAADALARPRLLARLAAGLERPLTLVVTPAGYGKTTLLRQWVDACPHRSAWLALDARDGDPASFLIAVVGALQAAWPDARPEVGRDALALLGLPAAPPPDYLGAALADALLDLPGPTLLVLDDYHTLADPAAHALMAALLEHPPPDLHLAIAGRLEPPLPLARLRARDQVTELRARDLAFVPDEARAFLERAAAAPLAPAAAAELERRTEGWATGLRLAALALREAGDAGSARVAAAFAGRRQRHALDFLLDEVLARQPAELETFLLRTAVVERVCGELAEALLDPAPPAGAGAAALRRLVEAELFTTALEGEEDERAWARYHPLFRELLLERLAEREGAEAVAALRRRAAAWLADHGLVDEAIEALLAAGEPDAAARLVEDRIHPLMNQEAWVTLAGWLRRVPRAVTERRPALLLAGAWVAHLGGRWAASAARLDAAAALLDRAGVELAPGAAEALRGEIDAMRAFTRMMAADGEGAVAAARRALARLPADRLFARGGAAIGLGLGLYRIGQGEAALRELGQLLDAHRGPQDVYSLRAALAVSFIHLQAADFPALRASATRLLALGASAGAVLITAWAHYLLGRVAYEWDDLAAAEAHYRAVLAERHRRHLVAVREALLGLALTHQAQGRPDRAEGALDDLEEFFTETGNGESLPMVRSFRARLELARGERPSDERPAAVGPPPRQWFAYLEDSEFTAIRAMLARGAGDERAALARLGAFAARAERERAVLARIGALAAQAVAAQARGEAAAALAHLEAALALAEPGGLVRAVLEFGAPLAAPLRALAARRPPSTYLARLLAAFDATPAAEPPAGGRPPPGPALAPASLLTEREAEVLEHLARHLTNKEIAAALSISPMTVKRHVSNVFDKLGVGSRRQAIAQAAALGLLTPAPR